VNLVSAVDKGASGYVVVPPQILVGDRTGAGFLGEVLPYGQPYRGSAGKDTFVDANVINMLFEPRPSIGGSITSYRTYVVIDDLAWSTSTPSFEDAQSGFIVKPRRAHAAQSARREPWSSPAAESPAEELRRLSGLTPAQLAQLFDVSRTTFYNWMEGASPREGSFAHLVETLNHVRDAKKRLAGVADLSAWLRTPVSAGGATPLQYLRQRRFDVFRGLVVRAKSPTTEFATAKSPVIRSTMSASARKQALERLSPRAKPDEDDD